MCEESPSLCRTTQGSQRYDLVDYAEGDVFMFSPESRGLSG